MVSRYLTVLLLVNAVLFSSQQTEKEIEENSIYVQFDKNEGSLLELHEWETQGSTSKFKDITAEVATEYCRNSTEKCSLVTASTVNSGDVMLDGDPEFFNGDVRLKVYVSLSGKNVKGNATVLPKAALTEIVTMGKPLYDTGLTDPSASADYNITLMFVDGVRVADPEDGTINLIMIIVSILILLSACLLAVVLKCKESMEEKKQLEVIQGGGRSANVPNDGENLTLTAVKPTGDEDGKDGGEAQPMI